MSSGAAWRQRGMDARNLADLYDSPLLEWSRIEARLAQGLTQAPGTGGPDRHTCWLATINPAATLLGTVEPGGATRWRF